MLQEYWAEIGGKPEAPKKRKGGKSTSESEATPGSAKGANKRMKREQEWSPPPGSWEHDVDTVDTVEENLDPATGKLQRYAYLVWKNQRKTQHPLAHVYQKCPQKVRPSPQEHRAQANLGRCSNTTRAISFLHTTRR